MRCEFSTTPSDKWPPKMSKTCVFLGRQTPFRHFSWRAEGGGGHEICLTSMLFWPSANELPWRNANVMRHVFAIDAEIARSGPNRPVNSYRGGKSGQEGWCTDRKYYWPKVI